MIEKSFVQKEEIKKAEYLVSEIITLFKSRTIIENLQNTDFFFIAAFMQNLALEQHKQSSFIQNHMMQKLSSFLLTNPPILQKRIVEEITEFIFRRASWGLPDFFPNSDIGSSENDEDTLRLLLFYLATTPLGQRLNLSQYASIFNQWDLEEPTETSSSQKFTDDSFSNQGITNDYSTGSSQHRPPNPSFSTLSPSFTSPISFTSCTNLKSEHFFLGSRMSSRTAFKSFPLRNIMSWERAMNNLYNTLEGSESTDPSLSDCVRFFTLLDERNSPSSYSSGSSSASSSSGDMHMQRGNKLFSSAKQQGNSSEFDAMNAQRASAVSDDLSSTLYPDSEAVFPSNTDSLPSSFSLHI